MPGGTLHIRRKQHEYITFRDADTSKELVKFLVTQIGQQQVTLVVNNKRVILKQNITERYPLSDGSGRVVKMRFANSYIDQKDNALKARITLPNFQASLLVD